MVAPLHERYPVEFEAYAAAAGATFNIRIEKLKQLGVSAEEIADLLRGDIVKSGGTIYCKDPMRPNVATSVDANRLPIPYEFPGEGPTPQLCEHYSPYAAFAKHYEVAGMDSEFIVKRYIDEPEERLKKAQDQQRRADAAFAAAQNASTRQGVDAAAAELRIAEAQQEALRTQYRSIRKVWGADRAQQEWFEKLAALPLGVDGRLSDFNDKAWRLSTPNAIRSHALKIVPDLD
jgi:hypothetical protein